VLDKETNLHYNYFRDYDPGIGRYIQSDPIGLTGGINTYGYVHADPLRLTDPSGQLAPIVAVGGVALVGGLAQGITSAVTGGSFVSGFVSGAAMGTVVALGVLTGGATIGAGTVITGGSAIARVGGIVGGLGLEAGLNSIKVGSLIRTANAASTSSTSKSCP
jgi:RHS repeat-associated protein